jgi:N-acetyl-anhydromuramyl-L-alanine amidase AmpD
MAAKDRSKSSRRRATVRSAGSARRLAPNRSQYVFMSLVAAMTLGAAVLYAVSRKPVAGQGGFVLPALMMTDSPSTVELVLDPAAGLKRDRWKSIVIHDSGEVFGSRTSLEEAARLRKLKGIGHHFVIGNGNGMGDGELLVTSRWDQQRQGAHVAGTKGEAFNRESIGICLVGDGNRQKFTRAQIARLIQLVDSLQQELRIPADRVHLHREIAAVGSPGSLFPAADVRRGLAAQR